MIPLAPRIRPQRPDPVSPRRRVIRSAKALAVAVAAALVVTGCSIQVTSQPDPSIPADTMLINADKGNPLFDRNFNPYLTNSRTAAKWMYEPLMIINPLDNEQTPWLASDWELPAPDTIVMTIRDGVEWSDGEPFTAEDVAFTFGLIKEFPAIDIKGAWQHIDTVSVEGNVVTFELLTDDAPALPILGATYIVPEHIWADVEDPGVWRNEDPIGTGPFVLGNYNQQQYSMDKNENYWQADSVEIQHLILPAANTQLDTVTRGYDWSYSFISDVEGTWGAASPNNKWWFPPVGVIGLMPNNDVEPFDNVHVRRGISLALERAAIAESASEGYMEEAGMTGLILPNQEDQLDPSIPNGGMIEQDADAALAEFEQAGYTLQGDRLVGEDGQQFSFAITSANGYSDWTRAAQEVQRQLGQIGIEVTLELPQPAGYQQAISNGDFQVAMGGMGGGNVYQAYNSLLSSEFYVPVGEATQNNFARYQNPEADEVLAALKATADPEEQLVLSHQLQNIVYDEVPVIGMYYGGSWGLYNDAKFEGWPSADDPYMAPQNYDSAPLLTFTRLTLAKGDDQ